jgi:hypothetical protein
MQSEEEEEEEEEEENREIGKSSWRFNENFFFKKKVWNVRSKKDLVDGIYTKYKISKTKIINLVGMFHSSYYWRPRFGKKGTKSSKLINHKSKG